MHLLFLRACAALMPIVLFVAGCQSYEPRPLDLEAHRATWLARTPASEPVLAFARRLEQPGDAATRFDPADGISLPEAEIIALVFNPDLRLARLRAGVATAAAGHAGLWIDPTLSVDVLTITESVSSPWIITPGLAFTIPLSGRLEAERARANAAADAELQRVLESEWQTRFEVRRAWLAWTGARLRLDETDRLIESMDSLVSSTGRLAESGEMRRTEAALFAIEQMQRRSERRRLVGDVAEAEQQVRSLLGLAPEAPVSFLPALDARGPVDPETDAQIDDRHPSLVRLRAEHEVAEQTLRREIRKQYPDLTIGPLYESDQGQSRIGFLGGFPVPVLNANRQGIAEAEAARELARAAFETQYERLAGALAAARARATARRAEREQIVGQVVPLVDRQLDDARRLLELGEGGGLVLLESLVRAHETRMHLLEIRFDEAQALAALAHLAGPPPEPTNTDPNALPADAADEVTP